MTMSGKSKTGAVLLEKQVLSGVRPIIEALDSLRILLGNDQVKVLTPRAETRMRTGYPAQIPLKAEVIIVYGMNSIHQVHVEFTFPRGYPLETIEIKIIKIWDEIFWTAQRQNDLEMFIKDGDHLTDIHALSATEIVKKIIMWTKDRMDMDANVEMNVIKACKLCRQILFDEHSILSDHSKRLIDKDRTIDMNSRCTSLFLSSPPNGFVIINDGNDSSDSIGSGSTQGKLICPNSKCGARVGQWSWIGSPCSCNEWISPAFQYTLSKIDVKYL